MDAKEYDKIIEYLERTLEKQIKDVGAIAGNLKERIKQLEAEKAEAEEKLNDWKRETFLLVAKIGDMLNDTHPVKDLDLYKFFDSKIDSWLIMEKSKNKLDNQ